MPHDCTSWTLHCAGQHLGWLTTARVGRSTVGGIICRWLTTARVGRATAWGIIWGYFRPVGQSSAWRLLQFLLRGALGETFFWRVGPWLNRKPLFILDGLGFASQTAQ